MRAIACGETAPERDAAPPPSDEAACSSAPPSRRGAAAAVAVAACDAWPSTSRRKLVDAWISRHDATKSSTTPCAQHDDESAPGSAPCSNLDYPTGATTTAKQRGEDEQNNAHPMVSIAPFAARQKRARERRR